MKREYIKVQVADLKPYERNPRRNDHAVAYVAESMKQVGYITPIVCDENMLVLAGETRLKAMKQSGQETVQVLKVSGLTEEQKKKYRILDNKVGEVADWDEELLEEELEDLDFEGFDFFSLDEAEEGWVPSGNAEASPPSGSDPSSPDRSPAHAQEVIQEDEDFDVTPPAQAKAKYGEVYQLGRHRLMCGDSTKPEDMAQLMGDLVADMLLTDPPYNVDYTGATEDKLKILNDNMSEDEYRTFLYNAFSSAEKFLRPGAVFYIWHGDSTGYLVRGACADVNWKVRQCLIWNKNSIVLGRQDYQWKHEPCLYGWKEGAGHTWSSDRKQSTVLDFNKPLRSDVHPTMKPLSLFAYQIENNTNEGDIVLDIFGGSGTTVLACEQDNRRACVMELDPHYVDVIIDRWETFTGEKAVRIS